MIREQRKLTEEAADELTGIVRCAIYVMGRINYTLYREKLRSACVLQCILMKEMLNKLLKPSCSKDIQIVEGFCRFDQLTPPKYIRHYVIKIPKIVGYFDPARALNKQWGIDLNYTFVENIPIDIPIGALRLDNTNATERQELATLESMYAQHSNHVALMDLIPSPPNKIKKVYYELLKFTTIPHRYKCLNMGKNIVKGANDHKGQVFITGKNNEVFEKFSEGGYTITN